ncbi:uncharacterized protein SCHCODRAFT_02751065 [Schizophyllum commune H4-8]|nr:uncharacterized protein SCHCODRAFT_02751065 [Schizophyllum commune H4-8]KAI5889528.1 hypothetical protein SCHCODRAFT_02751065 [Schizophyllum commune H4-8]
MPNWDILSDQMEVFHNEHKRHFEQLYRLADGSFVAMGWSLPLYLRSAAQFSMQLQNHHDIEEAWWFPYLGKRMPEFSHNDRGEHVRSHELIHKGLDDLNKLVAKWARDNSSYNGAEMRACLDSFREGLMKHLDDEVRDLKGENLKKYWRFEELRPLMFH